MPTPTPSHAHRRHPSSFGLLLITSGLALAFSTCSPSKPNSESEESSETTSVSDSDLSQAESTEGQESEGGSSTSGDPEECVGIDPNARAQTKNRRTKQRLARYWDEPTPVAAMATSTGSTSGDTTGDASTSSDSSTGDASTSSDSSTDSTDSTTDTGTNSSDSTSDGDSESTSESSSEESTSDSAESGDTSTESTSDSSDESSDATGDTGTEDTGTEDCSIPQDCIGFPSPVWTLQDYQSRSCGFGQRYGIENYRGHVVVIMLATSWSPMSQEQAQGLEAMRTMLSDRAVYFMTINAQNANSDGDRQPLIDTTYLPIFQDNAIDDVWSRLGGERDDFFVYDQMGILRNYFGADDSISLSTPSGYARLRDSITMLLD